jgi:hypothetical protein
LKSATGCYNTISEGGVVDANWEKEKKSFNTEPNWETEKNAIIEQKELL